MEERTRNNHLGTAIRDAREARGWSGFELARRAGVDRSRVSRIESGEARQPDPRTLTRLADALGVPSADLFALAGYQGTRELPSFRPYLRTKYGELGTDALQKLERYFEQIEHDYGPDHGPATGEDEEPEG